MGEKKIYSLWQNTLKNRLLSEKWGVSNLGWVGKFFNLWLFFSFKEEFYSEMVYFFGCLQSKRPYPLSQMVFRSLVSDGGWKLKNCHSKMFPLFLLKQPGLLVRKKLSLPDGIEPMQFCVQEGHVSCLVRRWINHDLDISPKVLNTWIPQELCLFKRLKICHDAATVI